MKYLYFLICIISTTISCSTKPVKKIILSPDIHSYGGIIEDKGILSLFWEHQGEELFAKSPLSIYYNDELIKWEIESSSYQFIEEKFNMPIGEAKNIHHPHAQTVFFISGRTLSGKTIDATLQIKAFNKALAYRFILNHNMNSYTIEERSELRLNKSTLLYVPNGEQEPIGNVTFEQMNGKQSTTPVIAKTHRHYLSLHEANLHNYPMMQVSYIKRNNAIKLKSGKAILEGKQELPWRVIFYGNKLEDLHNQKTIYLSLNSPHKGDFSWVKSGLSLWDWRVKGTTFNGFTYKMDNESLKRYIDFASENGISYFLLDDEWYDSNPLKPVKGLNIEEIITYSNSHGVGLILYYDLRYVSKDNPEIDFNKVANTYSSWGAKGIKFGFLGKKGPKLTSQEKTNRTEQLIKIAAENNLLIDFHDSPIPYSGLERTYPNYINREYCHAQLDCRMAFLPKEFVKIACVNMLAGPIDQTNGTYELNKMSTRLKGPRNEYYSTVASETARVFITHTGHLSVLIDAPEAYSRKADLFTFIKEMPSSWDETLYLKMNFNSHVSIARRSGDRWFLGTVYDEKGGEDVLKLNFLDEGEYEMILFTDSEETNYITNKEAYKISNRKVQKDDIISIFVAPGGGYTAIFHKKIRKFNNIMVGAQSHN